MELQRKHELWMLWALIALITIIVVTPFLVLRTAFDSSLTAQKMVTHTSNVEATAMNVAYETRNLESATLALATGSPSQVVRDRITSSREALPPLLDKLQLLTRDNPEQQQRVGMIRARIEQRLQLADDIIATDNIGDRQRGVQEMVTRATINTTVNDMVAKERKLLQGRQADAERTRKRTFVLGTASMVLQLALLSLLVVMINRQGLRRMQAELKERRSSGRAEAVLQTIREPIALVDGSGKLVLHNRAFLGYYGSPGQGDDPAEALVGQQLDAIGAGAWKRPDLQQRLHDVATHGRELWDFPHEQTTSDGATRLMLLNAQRLPDTGLGGLLTLITVSDVTPLKASEQHVQELNRQLEGKVEQVSDVNRELEAFSYSVSHDLRAPLRHIAGFAEKLRRHLGETADDKSLHYINVIQTADQRMAALIDDLLVYSRLGRCALRLQATDMQSLVDETRSMLDAANSGRKPIRWHIAPLPIVIADENMMRQVWNNLLGNAVKYSSQRDVSEITIAHRRLASGAHEFSITDNGTGFDMAFADKLFGVFQRLHKTDEFEGTGIGLASVKRVLMRHGSGIEAESRLGEGATFRFTLPAMLDNPVESAGNSA